MNKYEFSFWIKNNSNSEDIENHILTLSKKYNFELIKKIPVKTKTLAYPIEKETVAQFSTFYFNADPKDIELFKDEIKKIKDILRFIILKRKYIKELSTVEEKTVTSN